MAAGRIIGTFINYDNSKTYWLKIGEFGPIKYIEDGDAQVTDNDAIFFSDDPINISSEMEDTFENVYVRSCEINLIANFDIRKYVVAENIYDLPVEIRYDDEEGAVVFSGYVVPLSFNQSYAVTFNEFTVNCVDKLGLLEYLKFKPYITSMNYGTPRSFIDMIVGIENVDADRSKPIKFADKVYNIEYDHTQDTKINPQIFIGDDEENQDDWMTCKEALEEIGKIYGCYFWQDGDSLKVENILLYDLNNPYLVQQGDYMADDTNITIQEAYNRIECQVDLSTIDKTFIDPFKDDFMTTTTANIERVLTEIALKADDKINDMYYFMDWVNKAVGNSTTHVIPIRNYSDYRQYYNSEADPEIYDTYCQVVENKLFTFPTPNYLVAGQGNRTSDAWKPLKWLYDNPGKGGFFAFGRTEDILVPENDAEIKAPDMKTMLLIQVNGARQASDYSGTDFIETQITNNMPVCEFTLGSSMNFVPNDVSTTNYLVIDGKIRLNPITPRVTYKTYNNYNITGSNWKKSYDITEDEYTNPWLAWKMASCPIDSLRDYWYSVGVESWMGMVTNQDDLCIKRWTKENADDDEGFYYQYYTWDNVPAGIHYDPWAGRDNIYIWPYNQDPAFQRRIALPYLSPKFTKFKFKGASYRKNGEVNTIDNVKKVAILCCELIIGDEYIDDGNGNQIKNPDAKYLIENLNMLQTQATMMIPQLQYNNMYKWIKYSELPELDGVKQTWFTIGVNPKVDDNLLGGELSITDTSAVWMNITEQGLCIPISSKDALVGPVVFRILGPYNSSWDHNFKIKHGWLFNRFYTSGTENVPLMKFVENIQITDFKMSLVPNNQKSTKQNKDNDVVYYSDSNNIYQESQSFSCKFCTPLTNDDIEYLHINYEPNNSAILNMNNTSWEGMTYKGSNNVKLEEARVSEQYNIWKRPRNIIETTLRLIEPEMAYHKQNYRFSYLNYEGGSYEIYRTFNRKINLKYDTMTCTMKELSDEPVNT